MTLPENALKYDTCSLQELRKFVTDRNIPFRYTHAQSHTKKSQSKKERDERRKLLTSLQKEDAAATFRLIDLPPELRDQVYWHFFKGMGTYKLLYLDVQNHRSWMQLLPMQIRDEMSAVFDTVKERCEQDRKVALSFFGLRLGIDLGVRHMTVLVSAAR